MSLLYDLPHRRYNLLTEEWVLVSPHRSERPWQGNIEEEQSKKEQRYDPGCYLCPGNVRAGGIINDNYKNTFVFTNDFASLIPLTEVAHNYEDDLFRSQLVKGTCKVICFSPRHDLTLPEMELKDIGKVVELWVDQYSELSKNYRWVQIFENKGDMMGCSNQHPHGQIWALDILPNEAVKENESQKKYYAKNNRVLLLDYLNAELIKKERVIVQNENWVVLVPYWAVWPYETLLLPKQKRSNLTELSEEEKDSLASILKIVLTKYDNLFKMSFPYTMGWHNKPGGMEDTSYWQLHAHFYPPLLRSAKVKKFMVGYEMLSEAQRDITAEQAAENLRRQSEFRFNKY